MYLRFSPAFISFRPTHFKAIELFTKRCVYGLCAYLTWYCVISFVTTHWFDTWKENTILSKLENTCIVFELNPMQVKSVRHSCEYSINVFINKNMTLDLLLGRITPEWFILLAEPVRHLVFILYAGMR